MGKCIQISHKIVGWILIFAIYSLQAESTADTLHNLPPPTKKSYWKASTFAGCALLAVVGGIFAICWSGGAQNPKNRNHHKHRCDDFSPSTCSGNICPNTITADCMAGSCIYHQADTRDDCNHEHHEQNDCTPPCEILLNTPPCCTLNGGVPPF